MNIQGKKKIICEPAHGDSVWCKQLLSGLIKEFKKRRCNYEVIQDTKEIGYKDQIYIIGMNVSWLKTVVGHCNAMDCVPVLLSNQSRKIFSWKYHGFYH